MPETNHPNQGNALNFARLAGNNWRAGRDNAYAAAHGFILAVVVEDFARKPLAEDCKKAMKYGRMDPADQASVRKFFQHCGEVIDAWPTLPAEMRERYITSGAKRGGYVYSTLVGDIRKRDAEQAKLDATAELEQELAELGVTREEHEAMQEQAANELAFIAACDTIAQYLASGVTLSEQAAAAFAKLSAPAEQTGTNG
jgi:hypothetical protein